MSIQAYNVYMLPTADDTTSSPGSAQWILFQRVVGQMVQIPRVDPYVNLSVGVSVLNNAQLESTIIETIYVGS